MGILNPSCTGKTAWLSPCYLLFNSSNVVFLVQIRKTLELWSSAAQQKKVNILVNFTGDLLHTCVKVWQRRRENEAIVWEKCCKFGRVVNNLWFKSRLKDLFYMQSLISTNYCLIINQLSTEETNGESDYRDITQTVFAAWVELNAACCHWAEDKWNSWD